MDKVHKDKARIQSLIADFKVQERGYNCRNKCVQFREFLRGHLCARPLGRPVGVVMNLKGAANWGRKHGAKDEWHAFALVGFRTERDGSLVFITKNFWDGINPEVTERDLSNIAETYVVYAPSDGRP